MQSETEKEKRIREKLRRHAGPVLLDALADPKTIEVMLNPDGKLWLERLGEPMRKIGFIPFHQSQAILETVAGFHNREVLRDSPILECEWPLDGSRFAGQLPPIVSMPTFAIRKPAVSVYTLADYVTQGVMTERQKITICDAIRAKKNILVIGGTSTGKTTLVNAIIAEMVAQNPAMRLLSIEETSELQITADNSVAFYATTEVSMTPLLKTTLRMRPDRICVGETRGPEALDLLMAWNTGHPGGAATIHANSARAGITKMVEYISMHPNAPRFIEPLVGEAVDVAVSITRTEEGRRVGEILLVEGFDAEKGQFITTPLC